MGTAPRAAVGLMGALLLLAAGLRPALPATATFAPVGALPHLGSGKIWSLAVSPGDATLVLAGTDAGVYRSTDGGSTWSQTSLRGARAWVVGFDLRSPNAAFAGMEGQGVSRSDDHGASWHDASGGLPSRNVRALAFGLQGIAAGTSNGVAISADGRSWATDGLAGYDIATIVVSSNAPFTVVAGADGGDLSHGFLFRKASGDSQYAALQQGLAANAVASSLAVGPLPQTSQSKPLVLVTDKGTYHSGDGGGTWTQSTGLTQPDNQDITVSLTEAAWGPLDPNLVYAGSDAGGSSGGDLYRSTDGGASFTPASGGLPDKHRNVVAVAVVPASPPAVLVALDPSGNGGRIEREVDSTAPSPAATQAEPSAPPLATAPPTPRPTTRPPLPGGTPGGGSSSPGLLRRAVSWPFPLSVELFVLLAAAYAAMRWRQRYLDIEGPP